MKKKYHFLFVYEVDGEIKEQIMESSTLEYAVYNFVEHYIFETLISVTKLPGVIN